MIHRDQMGKTRAGIEGGDSGIRPTEIAGRGGRTRTYLTAQGENGAIC